MSQTSVLNHSTSHLPKLLQLEQGMAPAAPSSVAATGVARHVLLDLALKIAHILPQFTTEDLAKRMHLPQIVVAELLDQLQKEQLVEVLGHSDNKGYRYLLAARGKERALRALEVSGYAGPAPVSLEAYTAMFEWLDTHPETVTPPQVQQALSHLVLPQETLEIAGMAASSSRSLFLFGPPGNGKTSVGRALHNARSGPIWIPYAISVDQHIIHLFDNHCHEPAPLPEDKALSVDQRWVRIKRPFVVAGGEMTLESLDMAYLPSLRYYEAPLHMKANGGTFLIDDFGRQHVEPTALLNRWIIPLEHRIDYLTLYGGQKIQVPFLLMLIIATNLRPEDVTDPAFLRRIGYRLGVEGPTPEAYGEIFRAYARKYEAELAPGLVEYVLHRYRESGKELRACEPRDLIERVRDICHYRNEPLKVTEDLLDLAWLAYFGK